MSLTLSLPLFLSLACDPTNPVDSQDSDVLDSEDSAPDSDPPDPCVVDGPLPGELVITEISANLHMGQYESDDPDVNDWFEIANVSERELLLCAGRVSLRDRDGERFDWPEDQLVPAGEHIVFGPPELEEVEADVVVPTEDFNLVGWNEDDQAEGDDIQLFHDETLVDEVDWRGESWSPGGSGMAMQLDVDLSDAEANDDLANWCFSDDWQGEAYRSVAGTPGEPNEPCP